MEGYENDYSDLADIIENIKDKMTDTGNPDPIYKELNFDAIHGWVMTENGWKAIKTKGTVKSR